MADPLTPMDNDMPISEVVALTEVKAKTPPTPPSPVLSVPPVEAPKSPLFEDPDEIVVKRTL